MIIPSRVRALVVTTLVAAAGGSFVAFRDHRLGLTLSHYDARGHLVVARRIADSITPGWQQIGAVWLPLPHLLNAIPAQIDLFYRTGASAVAFSIASFAVATGAILLIVAAATGSLPAAIAGAAVFALNPNVLYLQATPMTEPLLIGLTTIAVAQLIDWCRKPSDEQNLRIRRVGWLFGLACLTRYEAWPVTACALAGATWVLWRTGLGLSVAVRRIAAIALYPAGAIIGFVIFSRVVVGQWFISGGFFVPENNALGHPVTALSQIGWGLRALSGPALLATAILGAVALAVTALLDRRRSFLAIPLALAATAALPLVAFVDGHPYRIRYMVPLIAAEAVCAGVAAGLTRSRIAALALLALAFFELRPLALDAPMVVEAQWDRPNVAGRRPVTDYLRTQYDGATIMASMGSLGHYMQDLSADGLKLGDFLHEGNGDIWLNALDGPRPYAGWILIEEQAEGGDMLAQLARRNPVFLEGYSRVAGGSGVALYRRDLRREPAALP